MAGDSWTEVRSHDELVALVGVPGPRAASKVRCTSSTGSGSPRPVLPGRDGGATGASPRGDPAGQLAYANISTNPQVGLLFLIPGRVDTLRVNQWARLVSDAPFF